MKKRLVTYNWDVVVIKHNWKWSGQSVGVFVSWFSVQKLSSVLHTVQGPVNAILHEGSEKKKKEKSEEKKFVCKVSTEENKTKQKNTSEQ